MTPWGHCGEMTTLGQNAGIVVTGATSGLGRAVALRFADRGIGVALVGRDEEALRQVTAEVRARNARAVPLRADLSDTAALSGLVDAAAAGLGSIGALVNAAATDVPGRAEDLELDEWHRVVAVNLTAPFALARSVMPRMRADGGGLIVNVSSVAGRRGWANASAYCSTKFALSGLTQSLAAEGREDGIRVCVLYPGAMATNWGTFDPEQRQGLMGADDADPADALDPATVADLIVWMATTPGQPVLNEVTITPLREQGWP